MIQAIRPGDRPHNRRAITIIMGQIQGQILPLQTSSQVPYPEQSHEAIMQNSQASVFLWN